jgi:TolB protein
MDIWVIDKSGRNIRQLTYEKSYDADPSWSPDGSKICFTSTRNGKLDIWVIECDGGNPSQLTGLTDSQGESKEPKWSR